MNTGTTRWMTPELMNPQGGHSEASTSTSDEMKKYPFKCDTYSFGMVCYEILTGEVPFQATSSLSDVRRMVLDGQSPELPNHCPDFLKNLIRGCWQSDASVRPKFGVICEQLTTLKWSLMTGIDVHTVSQLRKRKELTLRPEVRPRLDYSQGSPPDLPWVTCNGTVSGVLYRVEKGQVRIVCACHGRHMTPAEFVQHAGCVEVPTRKKPILEKLSQQPAPAQA